MDFTGKTAVITGAGQGVGKGIAMALSAHKANVALVGRTLSKVQEVADQIIQKGGSATAIECDVKNKSDIEKAILQTIEKFSSIDFLVNNAQEVPLGNLLHVDDEAFENGWKSGPLATFRFMKLCHPYLKGGGKIINLASSSALRADSEGYGAYASVKEAIRAISRTAAVEWGQDNILVNCIMPLAKSTGMEWWMNERPEEASAFVQTIPLGRVGDCKDDIGEAVCHLFSDGMSYITGSTIMLDGGQAFLR
ncbi:SDR family oxidoreductase [Gammaproteobacteria bacterium]|jgi:NAD(P)-dependent dehydrogenase (short-subunit alcohol dehydrogenase family)|nr:SDR family oxidoreductase [Gammaproteobacteria bacterium]MDA8720103.1 SDR family oxidoreductase [bacterium]MDA7851593.1 SDR family oxidoreductase [Gammaproteobacteria bacterium]MDA8925383.1 SDR family oxidoreductase [Gammaproteobacteria bacterium]MDA9048420.1 SDR family oxidoreductase [Gammaproteobacteria bacterium]|tara:strand:- start:2614 stop:3366 length:753 start_codon:yes stop_codon:yes gene_type:complete